MKTLLTFFATLFFSITVHANDLSYIDMSDQQKSVYGKSFQQCTEELSSLGKLDGQTYQTSKTLLDDQVNRATRYLLLRSKLSGDTQSVMDSIHQSNIAKVCQQIHQQLYTALLKEAEGG